MDGFGYSSSSLVPVSTGGNAYSLLLELSAGSSAIIAVNEVITLHMGPNDILLNLSVDFDDSISAGDVETAIEELTHDILTTHPDVKRVFIEAERADVETMGES